MQALEVALGVCSGASAVKEDQRSARSISSMLALLCGRGGARLGVLEADYDLGNRAGRSDSVILGEALSRIPRSVSCDEMEISCRAGLMLSD